MCGTALLFEHALPSALGESGSQGSRGSDEKRTEMKTKILSAVLLSGALALSAPLYAQDKTPPEPVDQAKLKADRDAAKASQANMTPEQKAAAKKAKRAKKQ